MSPKRDNEKVMREFKNRFPSFDIAQQEFLKQYRIVERLRRSVSCNEEVFRMADEKMQSSNPLKNAEFDKSKGRTILSSFGPAWLFCDQFLQMALQPLFAVGLLG